VKFVLALQIFCAISFAETLEFKKVAANIGKHGLVVELAQTEDERRMGLMHRTSLGENAGMLFVFEDEAPRSFWMKNTYIPLSIAYLNSKKEIVEIQDMAPMPKSPTAAIPSYPSKKPAKYALEVNQGWFKKRGIQVGQRLEVNLKK
jgi:uncharacterized protein